MATWLAVGFGSIGPALAAENSWDMDGLRSAIRGSRERVATYEREQRGLFETLEALDRSTLALRRNIVSVRRRVDAASSTLASVELEAVGLRARQRATQRAMAARAVALYRAGELGPVALLFAAEGIQDLLVRVHSLQQLLNHDAELLDRHRIESAALADAEARARDALENRDQALADLRDRSSQLEGERRVKRRLFARLQSDRTSERAALVELEIAARALEETLSSLEATQKAEPKLFGIPFESLRTRLPPPVIAPIAKRFGRVVDAEFHTKTFRKGVEFDAAMGTRVRAVASGQVRLAGWFRGYGKIVILDHGDEYFTVLGHLEEIRVDVGDNVPSGSVVGTVGDTGSLLGARLYFEIRHGGEPQDPADWFVPIRATESS
ncbi:MAG: peptidoglycan DD-metalloendopeptidase family protein [Myxococcota bacterium]